MQNSLYDDNQPCIQISQGSTWAANFILFNSEVYRTKLTEFFTTLQSNLSASTVSALILLVNSPLSKADLISVVPTLLSNAGGSVEQVSTFITLATKLTQTIPLTSVEVSCYFEMHKTTTRSKYFEAQTQILDPEASTVRFTLTPEQTQAMSVSRGRGNQTGRFVIEIKSLLTNEVFRITDGAVLLNRSAKQ